MYKLISVFIALVLLTSSVSAQSYQLVWSDEFNDTALNDFIWKYEIGNNNGWGNNELEYYTNNPRNVSLSDGKLFINALKENYQGFQYTSARVLTRISWKYGKIEARIKLPYGQGIWPAFWMLGANINSVEWPKSGEIDIMEMIGGQNRENTVYGTLHWYSNGHQSKGSSYKLFNGKLSDDFHVYSIEWDSQKIIWYVDGLLYYLLPFNSTMSAFQAPFFILLNLAVGGNWPGYPDNSTVFSQTMTVDYVRVYQIPTDVKNTPSIINEFSLSQNYPNPFNPETAISYQLSAFSFVTLKVFDMLGREVTTLVNEEKPAGRYQINWNSTDNFGGKVTSGVYFYTLKAGNFVQTKKMILLN